MGFVDMFKRKSEPISLSAAKADDFKGEWIAVIDDAIIAHNKDIGEVITVAKRDYKGKMPRYARIPAGNMAMY